MIGQIWAALRRNSRLLGDALCVGLGLSQPTLLRNSRVMSLKRLLHDQEDFQETRRNAKMGDEFYV